MRGKGIALFTALAILITSCVAAKVKLNEPASKQSSLLLGKIYIIPKAFSGNYTSRIKLLTKESSKAKLYRVE
jgi:hypothetical protein